MTTFNAVTHPTNVVDTTAPTIESTALSIATFDSSGSTKSGNLKATDKVVLTIDLGEAASGLSSLPTGTDSTVLDVGGSDVSGI